MGILPLQFADGGSAETLGLAGTEIFDVAGMERGVEPGQVVTVTARGDDGREIVFPATVRIDGPAEVQYHRHGGILRMVLRGLLSDRPV
jgi:aconitate hydratase